MKALGITSTAMLSLLLAVAAPIWAQEREQEQKDRPVQQKEKKAQPEKSSKQAEEPASQQEKNAKPEEKNAQQHTMQAQPEKQAQHASGGRIPDGRFKANFGQQHTFRVSQGDYGNRRFQYGSDLLTRGRATGSTPKTYTLSRLMACITCATRHIPA